MNEMSLDNAARTVPKVGPPANHLFWNCSLGERADGQQSRKRGINVA
jgi:hypothetical protein